MYKNAKAKGDALEVALEMIESALLHEDPSFANREIKIIPKRIIKVTGVRHEVDLWIEIAGKHGYDSLFLFECKNWKRKVDKNEVIVFREKIQVANAQRGFIVAHAFTRDAINQARKSSKIRLLTARELLTEELPTTISLLHGIWDKDTHFTATMEKVLPSATADRKLDQLSEFVVDGKAIPANVYLTEWGTSALSRSVSKVASAYLEEGPHEHTFQESREFAVGSFILDGEAMSSVTINGKCKLMIERGVIVSSIQVNGRGRAYQWKARLLDHDVCLDLAQTSTDGTTDQQIEPRFMRVVRLTTYTPSTP